MKTPFACLVLCAVVLFVFVAGGCEPQQRVPGVEGPVREWMNMKGVGLRQYSRAGREWTLLADEVEYERTSGEAVMKRIELRHSWRRPDGNMVDIVLQAPDGRARTDEGLVHLQGGVAFRDGDDNAVATLAVEYDRTMKTLDAPSPVTFTGRGVRFESPTFHADLDRSIYTFSGGVRGRFEPSLMKRMAAGERR